MSTSPGIDIQQEHLVADETVEVPEPTTKKKPRFSSTRQFVSNNAGFLLVLLAQAFFSLMNAAVKQLSTIDPPVSTLQIILVRMVITYICSLAYMIATGVDDPILGPKGFRMILVFRGIAGFVGLFGVYFSLQYLSLSDATVLMFLSPFCTAVACAIFLKETFRFSQALAGVVSLVGVILIARPPFLFKDDGISTNTLITPFPPMNVLIGEESAGTRMMAVGMSLLGVLGITVAYVTIRAIGKRVHTLHIMNAFASQSVLVTTLGMVATKTPFVVPTRWEWFSLLLMVGLFGFIAQVFLTMGLQREAAGRVTVAIYTQVVFATILQLIFFHTFPTWLSILGTVLILSSALYVAMTKEKTHTVTNGPVRLDADDYDHLEAALHAPQPKPDTTSP